MVIIELIKITDHKQIRLHNQKIIQWTKTTLNMNKIIRLCRDDEFCCFNENKDHWRMMEI